MILGITGGSGCGKTTLLDAIRDAGGLVLDCDAIYHTLLVSDRKMLNAIQSAFPEAFDGDSLDRKQLGTIVFSDTDKLALLNRITHAAVRQEVLRRLEGAPALAAIDAYALHEGGLAPLCDLTVAVTAPEDARVQRLTARDGISEAYARSRIAAQHSNEWFAARCDHVLENDGTKEAFTEKCQAFLEAVINELPLCSP